MNQTSWNLLYPAPEQPVLRSIPPDNPHIWDAGRWEGRERPVTHWGLGAQRWQPRAAPGRYTVRMTYNGKQYSQPFEVWRDVTLPSTDADLVASTELQRNIVTAMNEVVDKINRIEIMRAQVEDLRKQHGGNRQLDEALAGIYKRMYDTELHFLSRTEMHSDDKWYVEKYKLYLNLVWLLAEVGGSGGDVMGGVGFRPDQRGGRRVQGSAGRARDRAEGLRPSDGGRRGVQQGPGGEADGDGCQAVNRESRQKPAQFTIHCLTPPPRPRGLRGNGRGDVLPRQLTMLDADDGARDGASEHEPARRQDAQQAVERGE